MQNLWIGFNPYFNGYSTLTDQQEDMKQNTKKGFNPCFNGYSTLTHMALLELEILRVSILVLMDTLL